MFQTRRISSNKRIKHTVEQLKQNKTKTKNIRKRKERSKKQRYSVLSVLNLTNFIWASNVVKGESKT